MLTTPFPKEWLFWVDELIVKRVKDQYSPKASWKLKDFSLKDAIFFSQGIEELSDLFTEERLEGLPPYFQHPKYRSAYLLYFLPLQAAKFLKLFENHPEALNSVFQEKKLRIFDLGSGPGTASFGLIFALLSLRTAPPGSPQAKFLSKGTPLLEFFWFDSNKKIMQDGLWLMEALLERAWPELRACIKIHLISDAWWKAIPEIEKNPSALVFAGNVLNEKSISQRAQESWDRIAQAAGGGGSLWLEPANRASSQLLARLRDRFFLAGGALEESPERIWGPCLHQEACPMAQGRDWCHFSDPIELPGHWFRSFSKALGSERQWLKYSYLWISSKNQPAKIRRNSLVRVLSDPIYTPGKKPFVLICEPIQAGKLLMKLEEAQGQAYRGRLIDTRLGDLRSGAVSIPKKGSPIVPKKGTVIIPKKLVH